MMQFDNPLWYSTKLEENDQIGGIIIMSLERLIYQMILGMLSMTSTIECFWFEKCLMDIFLNNELTDFSFSIEVNGNKVVIESRRKASLLNDAYNYFDPITNKPKIIGTAGGSRIMDM